MSKVFIEESTLVGMADLIRESKGTTDLYDPANFSNEFREIIESGSGGASIDGGFTVNFYNEDGELIESHSVELGVDVYTPEEYGKLLWADSDGTYYTFPLTSNEPGIVYDLYLSDIPTCEEIIYGHCNVSKEEYSYLVVGLPSGMTGAYIGVYFFQAEPKLSGTTISNGGGAFLRSHIKVADDKTWTGIPYDMVSITTDVLSNEISLTSSASNINVQMKLDQTIEDARGTAYTNFEMQGVISEKSGRLDTTLYDHDGTLPRPYELQEKTVTENGDVVPDEGYYGLSKVSVNVESGGGTSIDGGYTVNFHNEDEELLGSYSALCGYEIDKPIFYTVKSWIDSNGDAYTFPLTVDMPGSTLDLYAYTSTTCAEELYSAYGVDINEYPYVFVTVSYSDDVYIVFGKDYSKTTGIAGNTLTFSESLDCYQAWSNAASIDLTDATSLTNLFISCNLSISSNTNQSLYVKTDSMNVVGSNAVDIRGHCTAFVDLNAPYNMN